MCFCFQAADEPAYLTVGTDVSAKYRGAFCEAKIKTVKRLVKVKVRDLSESRMIGEDHVASWLAFELPAALTVCLKTQMVNLRL